MRKKNGSYNWALIIGIVGFINVVSMSLMGQDDGILVYILGMPLYAIIGETGITVAIMAGVLLTLSWIPLVVYGYMTRNK